MNAATLRALHEKLSARVALSPVRLCNFAAETRDMDDVEAGEQALIEFAPALGSLTRTGAHHWIGDARQIGASRSDGMILEAELVDAHGSGLQLRHLGDRWRLTRIRETEGESCLADEMVLLGRPPAPQKLRYRRYWEIVTGHGGVRPVLAVLIGAEAS